MHARSAMQTASAMAGAAAAAAAAVALMAAAAAAGRAAQSISLCRQAVAGHAAWTGSAADGNKGSENGLHLVLCPLLAPFRY